MDKFYARLGWVVFAGLLTGVYLAYSATSFDHAIAVLWAVQLPLFVYISIGIGMLFNAPRHVPAPIPARLIRLGR